MIDRSKERTSAIYLSTRERNGGSDYPFRDPPTIRGRVVPHVAIHNGGIRALLHTDPPTWADSSVRMDLAPDHFRPGGIEEEHGRPEGGEIFGELALSNKRRSALAVDSPTLIVRFVLPEYVVLEKG